MDFFLALRLALRFFSGGNLFPSYSDKFIHEGYKKGSPVLKTCNLFRVQNSILAGYLATSLYKIHIMNRTPNSFKPDIL